MDGGAFPTVRGREAIDDHQRNVGRHGKPEGSKADPDHRGCGRQYLIKVDLHREPAFSEQVGQGKEHGQSLPEHSRKGSSCHALFPYPNEKIVKNDVCCKAGNHRNHRKRRAAQITDEWDETCAENLQTRSE